MHHSVVQIPVSISDVAIYLRKLGKGGRIFALSDRTRRRVSYLFHFSLRQSSPHLRHAVVRRYQPMTERASAYHDQAQEPRRQGDTPASQANGFLSSQECGHKGYVRLSALQACHCLPNPVFSIARNFSESPLLRLPLEIRNDIWRNVLGGQLIHLKYERLECPPVYEPTNSRRIFPYESWLHHVCDNDGPEDKKETTLAGISYSFPLHWHCELKFQTRFLESTGPCNNFERVSLTVLYASRQIYAEANHILWTTNTFAFANPATFKHFIRTVHQKRLVRKLRLSMLWNRWHMDEVVAWNSALSMPTIRSLPGLRSVRLHISHNMDAENYATLKNNNSWYKTEYCTGLQKLSTLLLTEAEVAVKPINVLGEDRSPWTVAQCKEYADGLRKLLLDPNGAEIYAEEQREVQELSRKVRESEAECKN